MCVNLRLFPRGLISCSVTGPFSPPTVSLAVLHCRLWPRARPPTLDHSPGSLSSETPWRQALSTRQQGAWKRHPHGPCSAAVGTRLGIPRGHAALGGQGPLRTWNLHPVKPPPRPVCGCEVSTRFPWT